MTFVEKTAAISHLAVIVLCLVVAACAGLLTRAAYKTDVQVNATLADINRPCKGAAGPDACGTLAQLNKSVIDIGDITVVAQKQVAQSGELIAATTSTISTVGTSVISEVNALHQTTDAATQSLQTLTAAATPVLSDADTTVRQANVTIAGLQPVETSATKAVQDFDLAVNNPAIPKTIDNVQIITENLGATSTDFQTKFHALLYPPPCKTFGCKLARTWPYIKGAAEMAEPFYWGQQLIENHTP